MRAVIENVLDCVVVRIAILLQLQLTVKAQKLCVSQVLQNDDNERPILHEVEHLVDREPEEIPVHLYRLQFFKNQGLRPPQTKKVAGKHVVPLKDLVCLLGSDQFSKVVA